MGRVHAFIISWEGHGSLAASIAAQIGDAVERLTVIYSNAAEASEGEAGNWVRVPNTDFYGRKFKKALDLFASDIFPLINAETSTDDWRGLRVVENESLFVRHPMSRGYGTRATQREMAAFFRRLPISGQIAIMLRNRLYRLNESRVNILGWFHG